MEFMPEAPDQLGEARVRSSTDPRRASEWALVLAARGVAHRVDPEAGGHAVVVAEHDAPRARRELDSYDVENAPRPRATARPEHGATGVGVAAGASLVAFFLVTGPRAPSTWFVRGAARSWEMLHGEPWRAVTALTLHADAAHVVGNAVALGVLLTLLGARLGPGTAAWLALLSGALGNTLAAVVDRGHDSVGASTAVFGVLGALAGLAALDRARPRAWTVWGAALALLAMLGTGGKNTDLLSHALGLTTGAALGLAVAAAGLAPRRSLAQGLGAIAALLVVALAWRLALGNYPIALWRDR